jgi:hypothetical protein
MLFSRVNGDQPGNGSRAGERILLNAELVLRKSA